MSLTPDVVSTFTLENGSVLKGEVADALIQAERVVKEAEDNLSMERMVSPEHVRLEKLKGFELALKDAEGYFRGLRAALTLGQTL